jgi:hypothetical protein
MTPTNQLDKKIALFRKLALSFEGAVEGSHMGQPDFRFNNRIFATLAAQSQGCGMVKLTAEQQALFTAEQPDVFTPVTGGWGKMGCTHVHLLAADEAILLGGLSTAFHNLQKKLAATKPSSTRSRNS